MASFQVPKAILICSSKYTASGMSVAMGLLLGKLAVIFLDPTCFSSVQSGELDKMLQEQITLCPWDL